MADQKKAINWNSVVTNAVSMLVAAVFVGAAAIVWNAATTIDTRIETATGYIRNTQKDLQASQKTMTEEIASLHAEIRKLRSQLDSHDEVLRDQAVAGTLSKDEPIILPKYRVSDPQMSEMKAKDVERILQEYQKNRSLIQQQSIP